MPAAEAPAVVVPAPASAVAAKTRAKNFTTEDQIALCNAWLDVSEDPVVGTDQCSADFWAKVADRFNHSMEESGNAKHCREPPSIQMHWRDILQKSVNKFCGAYAKAKHVEKSGYTEQDYIELAQKIYSDSMPKQQAFKLLHCWQILRNKPKWTGYITERRTPVPKRTASALEDEGEQADNPTVPVRPIGCKKAKALGPKKLQLAEAALALRKDHSEKAIAELLRKNELLQEMNGIELFRNDTSEDAAEFLKLTREQHMLSARLKLAQTKKCWSSSSSCIFIKSL